MLHFQFIQSQLLFETLKERLKLYVISLRHPLWLVESWYRGAWHRGIERYYGGGWGERFGSDPREFTLCCEIGGITVPWFAADWHEEYARLRPLDQAIQVVYRLNEKIEERYQEMSEQDREKVLFAPFELFTADPLSFVRQWVRGLNTSKTPSTSKMMKKIQVPRPMITAEEMQKQREKLETWMDEEKAAVESRGMLDRMCAAYEARYLERTLFAERGRT